MILIYHQEVPISEVSLSAEEHLEQDVLQPQDVNTPVGSTEDDNTEDLDMCKFTSIIQNIKCTSIYSQLLRIALFGVTNPVRMYKYLLLIKAMYII